MRGLQANSRKRRPKNNYFKCHHLQYQVPVTTWQNLLKYQHLNLASHHLYGSSRLGTKDYLEGQLYAKVDLTGSQPFMDTLMLTARRPWYSMDYDELITGAGQTPWGMAATEPYHFAAQIGQKQYELSNHLGNVQATVSDLPYMATFTQANTDVPGVKYEPSLRSAYDYYPFGMLMPGRYVSDTTERCMTISRTGWSTILVDSCWPLAVMYVQSHTTGGGSISHTGGNLVLSAPLAGDAVSIAMQVASGVENTFEFDVNQIAGAAEEGVLVSVLETIDNVPYVIGGGRLQLGGKQKINFRSFGNNVSLLFTGPLDVMEIAKVCTKYPKSVQHTYLVDVCDESKDRYRFGYNGQEKVNEIAGVGNHNTAQFWEYDTRLGRRWNLDPKPNESISSYATFGGNPIKYSDINGDTLKVEYKGKLLVYGEDGKFYDGKKEYEGGKNKKGEYKGFLGEVSSGVGNLNKSEEGASLVKELIRSENNFIIKESTSYGADDANYSGFDVDNGTLSHKNNPELIRLIPNQFSSSRKSSGSGGTIFWNPYNRTSGFNTDGNYNSPPFITLGHEMVHARDANRGISFPKFEAGKYSPKHKGLWKTEWRAVYYENIIRMQLKLPLRTNYGINKFPNGDTEPQAPYLLDDDKKPVNYTGQ